LFASFCGAPDFSRSGAMCRTLRARRRDAMGRNGFIDVFESVGRLVETSIGELAFDKRSGKALMEVMDVLLRSSLLNRDDAETQAAAAAIAFKERVQSNAEDKLAVVVRLCKRINDVALAYDESSHVDWLDLVRRNEAARKGPITRLVVDHVLRSHPTVNLECRPTRERMLECIRRKRSDAGRLVRVKMEIVSIPSGWKDFVRDSFMSVLSDAQNSPIRLAGIEHQFKSRFLHDWRFTFVTTAEEWNALKDAWEIAGVEFRVESCKGI